MDGIVHASLGQRDLSSRTGGARGHGRGGAGLGERRQSRRCGAGDVDGAGRHGDGHLRGQEKCALLLDEAGLVCQGVRDGLQGRVGLALVEA